MPSEISANDPEAAPAASLAIVKPRLAAVEASAARRFLVLGSGFVMMGWHVGSSTL
jgi:hypothetical protein